MIHRTISRRLGAQTTVQSTSVHTVGRRRVSVLFVLSGVLATIVLSGSLYLGVSNIHPLAFFRAAAAPEQDTLIGTQLHASSRSISTATDPKTVAYIVERDRTAGKTSVEQGQILAMDTTSLRVIGRIDAMYDPQVEFAPDGKYLYIAETSMAGDIAHEQLRVVEVATGQTINTVAVPHRYRSTAYVSPGVLAVSHQGRYVYVENAFGIGDQYALATYDGTAGQMLPTEVPLPRFCGATMLWPLSSEGTVAAVCLGPAHSVTVADVTTGKVTTITAPDAPGFINGIPKAGLPTMLAGSVRAQEGDSIFIVTRGGVVHHFDGEAHKFLASIPLTLGRDIAVADYQVQLSRDGQRLYLGVGSIEATSTGLSEQVQVYDTTTWKLLRTVPATEPTRSIAVTPDEQILMLYNKSRTISQVQPDSVTSALDSVLNTPGNQLDAIVTLP